MNGGNGSPILQTHNLTCRFGGLVAVDDVSIDVEKGTVFGIIGPNGAGKTTVINMITGFIKPTAGRVVVEGNDVTGQKPWQVSHAGVARTFQIVKPFRDMTVRDNVAMGSMFRPGQPGSLQENLSRADDVLERVGLADKASNEARDLAVVDARRLELAKALAMGPRVLLLDEVMAGLRHREINQAVELIGGLKSEGITIVAIEHVMKAILAISDVLFVLHEGKELAKGSPQEIAADERVIEAYLGERYAKRTQEQNDA